VLGVRVHLVERRRLFLLSLSLSLRVVGPFRVRRNCIFCFGWGLRQGLGGGLKARDGGGLKARVEGEDAGVCVPTAFSMPSLARISRKRWPISDSLFPAEMVGRRRGSDDDLPAPPALGIACKTCCVRVKVR
jgi:hypothetical protein